MMLIAITLGGFSAICQGRCGVDRGGNIPRESVGGVHCSLFERLGNQSSPEQYVTHLSQSSSVSCFFLYFGLMMQFFVETEP